MKILEGMLVLVDLSPQEKNEKTNHLLVLFVDSHRKVDPLSSKKHLWLFKSQAPDMLLFWQSLLYSALRLP